MERTEKMGKIIFKDMKEKLSWSQKEPQVIKSAHPILGKSNKEKGFPGDSDSEESACNSGDPGLIPRLARSPGERNDYSFLENFMDRGA